jgi:hypothetical protein
MNKSNQFFMIAMIIFLKDSKMGKIIFNTIFSNHGHGRYWN